MNKTVRELQVGDLVYLTMSMPIGASVMYKRKLFTVWKIFNGELYSSIHVIETANNMVLHSDIRVQVL